VVLVDAGVAEGGPAAGAGAWRRHWRRAAVLRRGWASRDGLGTFSGPRGTRSGARLERRWSGGEGSTGSRSFGRLQWRRVVTEPIPADSAEEKLDRGLGKVEGW
jgi:hypothetical protein